MTAETGDTVTVHYTGKLDDGTVFDSSRERDPLQFTLGDENVIPGFQNAIRGQAVGDKFEVEVGPKDAYGPHDEERIVTVARDEIPEEVEVEPGKYLQAETPQGPVTLKVLDSSDDQVKLDGNHPLAGQQLNFEIEILEIDKNADGDE